MTDAERTAFRAEVRAYLLDNPEVLMEAIGVLEQREAVAQSEADRHARPRETARLSGTTGIPGSVAIPRGT